MNTYYPPNDAKGEKDLCEDNMEHILKPPNIHFVGMCVCASVCYQNSSQTNEQI